MTGTKGLLEGDWVDAALSRTEKQREKEEREEAPVAALYSRILPPLAFTLCANAPSFRLAALSISGWTLLQPAAVRAATRCTKLLGNYFPGS
jgi:hypothetical protein